MTAPAKSKSAKAGKRGGVLSKISASLGLSRAQWEREYVAPAQTINESDLYRFGNGLTSSATLLGRGKKAARTRQVLYEKWMRMEGDPIVSSAVKLLVTAALGGHETTGDCVFIEENADLEGVKKFKKIIEDVQKLAPLFNRCAFTMAYTAVVYGDSYARIYSNDTDGVTSLSTDELFRPQLVQAFERGGRTIGYAVTVGERNFERLNCIQMGRMMLQRAQWIPQFGIVEKSFQGHVAEDDPEKLDIMPAMVGGSLLYNAEEPYDNLAASLIGLVGQRWIDSIDEQLITLNLEGTDPAQQTRILDGVKSMLQQSKLYAQKCVEQGTPNLERIRYVIPTFNEKQVLNVMPAGQSGRANNITIDDIMVHARLLAGALGVDLSMIGFADQLSGGLGEGGFFRVSALIAESSRVIRNALEAFINSVIDIHTLRKFGMVFKEGERPWNVNFFGSISARESEEAHTRADSMNAGAILVQTMQAGKELGFNKEIGKDFLMKQMKLDEPQAELYAKVFEQQAEGGGDPFGGGGGGGGMNPGGFPNMPKMARTGGTEGGGQQPPEESAGTEEEA